MQTIPANPSAAPGGSHRPSLMEQWLRAASEPAAFAVLADLMRGAAVYAVDGQRNIVHWSAGAERLLGFRAQEVLGQHCLKASRCGNCLQGCGIAERGMVTDQPIVLHREDGTAVPLRKTAQAFFDPEGRFLGGIEVLVPDDTALPKPLAPAGALAAHGLLSRDPAMLRSFEILRNVAPSDVTVLLRGESGTGKELLARALHLESPRRAGPFLAINCAALTPTLLESELFGHARGAFTGAVGDRPGLFSLADGGTLFLDEVAELPLELQAKLLRVIQERTFVPVGGSKAVTVDVRIVSATHRSLRELVRQGRFREDLMYRLRVVPIFLPSLRERRGDIDLLLWHFIAQRNALGRRIVRRIAPDALHALLSHAWPGNVRELQNVLDYSYAVGAGESIRLEDLPPEFHAAAPGAARPATSVAAEEDGPARRRRYARPPVDEERARVAEALHKTGGDVGRAGSLLGMSRPTLWRKRKRYGL